MHVKLLVIVLALCFGVELAQGQRDAHAAKLTASKIEGCTTGQYGQNQNAILL
jgi:hypothetical protein